MPKRVVPLTDVQVKNAKPKDKDYKLSDGFGLVFLVKKTGGKLWHFNYTYEGKQLLLSLVPTLKSLSQKLAKDVKMPTS
jgi:hypothetical protein